jgi:hypothetical protein
MYRLLIVDDEQVIADGMYDENKDPGIIKAVEQAVVEIEEQTKSADILFNAKQQLQSMGLLMKKDFLSTLLKGDPKALETHYSMNFSWILIFQECVYL